MHSSHSELGLPVFASARRDRENSVLGTMTIVRGRML